MSSVGVFSQLVRTWDLPLLVVPRSPPRKSARIPTEPFLFFAFPLSSRLAFSGYRLGRLEVAWIRYNYGIMSVPGEDTDRVEKLSRGTMFLGGCCATIERRRDRRSAIGDRSGDRIRNVKSRGSGSRSVFPSFRVHDYGRSLDFSVLPSRRRAFPRTNRRLFLFRLRRGSIVVRYRLIAQRISSMRAPVLHARCASITTGFRLRIFFSLIFSVSPASLDQHLLHEFSSSFLFFPLDRYLANTYANVRNEESTDPRLRSCSTPRKDRTDSWTNESVASAHSSVFLLGRLARKSFRTFRRRSREQFPRKVEERRPRRKLAASVRNRSTCLLSSRFSSVNRVRGRNCILYRSTRFSGPSTIREIDQSPRNDRPGSWRARNSRKLSTFGGRI